MTYISDTSAQDTQVQAQGSKTKLVIPFVAIIAFIVFIYFIVTPAIANWSSGQSAVELGKIRIAQVEQGMFVRDFSVQGRVIAAKRPVLYSPAQGTVTYLVEAGDSVSTGQTLAIIDSPELKSLYDQEIANLTKLKTHLEREKIQVKKSNLAHDNLIGKAEVSLNAARREMRRSEEAMKNSVISDIDYQKAKDDLQNAEREYQHVLKEVALLKESQKFEIQTRELELESQQVKVTELKRQVDGLKINSPVTGLVGNLNAQQKNSVAKNQPLLSVVDLTQYELEVSVPESYADDLALGMEAEITLNQTLYEGELVAISPEITKGTVNGKIRFKDDSLTGLRQNQRLTTRIILEQKNNIAFLPRGQFINTYNGQFAYVVKDNEAVKTPIKLGSRSLAQVEILSGLKQGDQVVISDNEIFKDAPSVRILQ
ncbi:MULTISPECIES: efflux RND transporter periplasmic adaptor subunit [Pseudoalteromonas]|uniref:Efflux transporter periplasmic adaptor subunit n=1 Tax=Pseudoalteromonas amylolytica TaxID=1859457 RepID=A0A1S1MTX9_9GAMM|nr:MULTISPECIES: efflux RND transporter periplasmic adaptor subunit [Pseudoalteromonas]OHU85109.1 efflux transporter periplasmic adaptor subunit [Pseudoalteromonas sp. JW3]OHU89940.1 efflux transporter periplasmic adaptor subunit [Pseudoalteromonas amylolytica]